MTTAPDDQLYSRLITCTLTNPLYPARERSAKLIHIADLNLAIEMHDSAARALPAAIAPVWAFLVPTETCRIINEVVICTRLLPQAIVLAAYNMARAAQRLGTASDPLLHMLQQERWS